LIYSYVRAQVRQHKGILTLVQNMQTLGQLFEPLYLSLDFNSGSIPMCIIRKNPGHGNARGLMLFSNRSKHGPFIPSRVMLMRS